MVDKRGKSWGDEAIEQVGPEEVVEDEEEKGLGELEAG